MIYSQKRMESSWSSMELYLKSVYVPLKLEVVLMQLYVRTSA
jgi:hypothetical protein